jgi:hypothetical protein
MGRRSSRPPRTAWSSIRRSRERNFAKPRSRERFACATCGAILTPPLVEAIVCVNRPRDLVLPGMYYVARDQFQTRPGQILVHGSDLAGVRFTDDTRRAGSYLSPGDLPNLACANGHRIGYGFTGGAYPDVHALEPALVQRRPPG